MSKDQSKTKKSECGKCGKDDDKEVIITLMCQSKYIKYLNKVLQDNYFRQSLCILTTGHQVKSAILRIMQIPDEKNE